MHKIRLVEKDNRIVSIPWTWIGSKTARCCMAAGWSLILWKVAEEEADDSLFHIPLNGVIVMNLVTIP